MKKHILTITFLAIICYHAFGQTAEYKFTPKWKEGDKKTVTIEQNETEYKNGELVEENTSHLTTEIEILKENNDDYILKVVHENIALRTVVNFYDKLGDELNTYKNLKLEFRINKQTGKADLINWKDAQQFMNESFDQINTLLKKKVPDMAGIAKRTFVPIVEMFKSKENIEAYMSNEIGFLLFPYDKIFVVGDTLSTKESCANPFNPLDMITQTTLSYLSNLDETKKICDINTTEIYDLTEFKEMMKTMMENMTKSLGAEDSTRDKAAKEINSIDFDMSNLTVITFDYNSTWPVKVVKTGKVTAGDPKGKTERTVIQTMTIK